MRALPFACVILFASAAAAQAEEDRVEDVVEPADVDADEPADEPVDEPVDEAAGVDADATAAPSEPEQEAEPEAVAEPEAEPGAEAEPEAEPEAQAEPEGAAEPEREEEPAAEPEPAPQAPPTKPQEAVADPATSTADADDELKRLHLQGCRDRFARGDLGGARVCYESGSASDGRTVARHVTGALARVEGLRRERGPTTGERLSDYVLGGKAELVATSGAYGAYLGVVTD